jgi:hypothetical protein
MDSSDTRLRELSQVCSSLSLVERKALITLARSQSIPVVEIDSSSFHSRGNIVDKAVKDVRILQSWRHNRYVDLDDPSLCGIRFL